MKQGDRVRVQTYEGDVVRRVVSLEGERVFVCTDEEYEAASRERREPTAVGFRPEAVRPATA